MAMATARFPRAALALVLLCAAGAAPLPGASAHSGENGPRRVLSEQNGSVTIHNGDRVRVRLDQGDVHVRTTADGSAHYRLRIEAPANYPAGRAPRYELTGRVTSDGALITGRAVSGQTSGHYWVTLELEVPRVTPLEVATQGGAIEVQDIDGRLQCETAGGKIHVGRVGNSARLDTAGGDIVVQDIAGDLAAATGGGQILAGSVHGSATLRSGGGHVRVERVDGIARIDTGGGNIFLDRAGGRLMASTGGGRIMVGEVTGELEARTGGGGIRVWRVAGPARVESGGGSIFLAGVTSPVRASTAAGGITARFASPASAPAAAARPPEPPRASTLGELECNGGNIVVFVPVDLGLNLDASVEGGENFHIVVDPALALKVKSNGPGSSSAWRAEGPLGGGGPLLRLRANSGNILLRPASASEADGRPGLPADPALAPLPAPPPLPPAGANLDAATADLEQAIAQMQHQLEIRQDELESFAAAQELQAMRLASHAARREWRRGPARGEEDAGEPAEVEYNWSGDQISQMDDLREKLTSWFTDRVVLSAEQLRPRLVHRVDPVYPESARQSGAEGPVRLRVAIARDGSIEDVSALSGNAELAGAAVAAVRRWRYRPTILNGKPVPVLTVLTITFHRP
jgi:TonB family protein